MAIKGYYVNRNFFSRNPQEQKVTFYLTDGGRTNKTSPIMRIKDVYISIDYNYGYAVVNVPKAYTTNPFIREFNLLNTQELNEFRTFIEDVKEWLGYTHQWRKVGRTYKHCTIITITDKNEYSTQIFEGIDAE